MTDKLKRIFSADFLFFLITGCNLFPLAGLTFFPTMDGPAHLYNSTLISNLLFGGNTTVAHFFALNTMPVPNWTGHFILSFFNLFLSGNIAEKILIVLYLVGLPFSFRYLIKALNPQNAMLSFLIFPFTYSFLFLLGFYNFSLALIFFFFALGYWIKNQDKQYTLHTFILLGVLVLLTYFSHVFVFGMLLFVMVAHTVFTVLFANLDNLGFLVKEIFRRIKIIVMVSLLPFLLFAGYVYSTHGSTSNLSFIDPDTLMDWIKNIRPIIVYNPAEEEMYTKKIAYLLLGLAVIAVYDRVNHLLKNDQSFSDKFFAVLKHFFRLGDFWLFAAGGMLYLYFKLPDSDGSAGYISVRLGLLFFLFVCVWLGAQNIPKWFGSIVILLILFCHFNINRYHRTVLKDLDKMAVNCHKAAEKIAPQSVVLPLNFSDNWLVGHFSNYLGSEKPMVILENYECSTGYFPVKWNNENMPNAKVGTLASGSLSCYWWQNNPANPEKKIDYVFMIGNIDLRTDSCTIQFKNELLQYYTMVYENETGRLYQLKL